MNDSIQEIFGEAIHTYTRADVIRDGLLVTLDPQLTREAGFTWPVDMTAAAYRDAVRWGEAEQKANPRALQDETGRAWDVLTMCRYAIKSMGGKATSARQPFQVLRVRGDRRASHPTLCNLLVAQGWTDEGTPTLTIMQPHED